MRERLTDFYQADLDHGLPAELGDDFDVVLAADVLEHVRSPERAARRDPHSTCVPAAR